jgi:hypothetical protein
MMVLKQRNLLPKIWVSYVDEIFCVFNRRKVNTLLMCAIVKKRLKQLVLLGRQSDQKRFVIVIVTYQHSALYPYHNMSSHGTQNGCFPLHVAPGL